ncbi:M4 family metallopeptidase [Nonomuraea sp. NPDC059023]|uniref:M4 family metallopeptidase n=1 Tax=unclassified Nonomuraea TaxID=2593643 RepID=UPI0036B5762C
MSWRPITSSALALSLALAIPLAGQGPAHAADPPAVEPRAGTDAPAEVSGLAEAAAGGDLATAAKNHLKNARYHLDPADLTPIQTVTDGQDTTVRFAQKHRGLPVLGGQYLVHFRGSGAARQVTGAGGRFLTELSVDTTPRLTAETAGRIALTRFVTDPLARRTVKTGQGSLVVVPRGAKGRLAWKLPMTGLDRAKKKLLAFDAYIDAHSGQPLQAISRIQMEGPATGSGTASDGRAVPLNLYQRADGVYETRDRARPMWNGTTGEILTYDANKGDLFDYLVPGVPPGAKLAESPTPVFGPGHTESGAADAHWGTGKVYEYYRGLGREGLDGKGGSMLSVVNVTFFGQPFENALWDGTKMVYGGGGPTYHSLAAGLDVVGHEMTHGVITNSANLAYFGQSGAMNEGLADYFGNAIEVDALGVPMSHPDASLVGDRLCKTLPPKECAIRDLDDGRSAAKDWIGVGVSLDGGGVHLNSTIFSGALWDIREKLGAKADKVVYKALTEYMTPIDDFADGRRAVESAARALGVSPHDRVTIALAFERHGIRRGWERGIRTDSRVLVDNISDGGSRAGVAGDRYVVGNSSPDAAEPTSILTGRLRGGKPVKLSQNTSWNFVPVIDGRRAVWGAFDADAGTYRILTRPLDAGAPEQVAAEVSTPLGTVTASGEAIAWDALDTTTFETEVWLKKGTAPPVNLTAAAGVLGVQPELKGGKLSYLRVWRVGEKTHTTPVVYDVVTGTETPLPEVPSTGQEPSSSGMPVLTSKHVVWYADTDADDVYGLVRANHDGTGLTWLVPDGPKALLPSTIDANDDIVTVGVNPHGDGTLTNANLPKLFQLPVAGGPLTRFSCNRGDQFANVSGDGTLTAWIDGSAGDTDLVYRERPAGRC